MYLEFINGTVLPTTPGWAIVWINTETTVLEEWRDKFYEELVSQDLGYREELNQSIRDHGVRWS